MANKYAVETAFKLIDKATDPLSKIGVKGNAIGKQLKKDFMKAQDQLSSLGKSATKAGLAIAAAGAIAVTAWAANGVKDAVEYDLALRKVSTVADTTTISMDEQLEEALARGDESPPEAALELPENEALSLPEDETPATLPVEAPVDVPRLDDDALLDAPVRTLTVEEDENRPEAAVEGDLPTFLPEKSDPLISLIWELQGRPNFQVLSNFPVIVGNSAETADLILPDASVAAVHACLFYVDGIHYVEDWGSEMGTYVNYKRVLQKTPVTKDDILRVGHIDILITE